MLAAIVTLAGVSPTLAAIGSIYGQVHDSYTGEPIARATVRLSSATSSALDTSYSTGAYILDGLPGTAYTLQVSASGYHTRVMESVELIANTYVKWDVALTPSELPRLGENPEDHDQFGRALATGDFDGDGFDDLAVGAPYEDVGAAYNAGAVTVLYGADRLVVGGHAFSGVGITSHRNQVFNQNTPGVPGGAENPDSFGAALAAGDFDGDGYDDLAIGAPFESVGSIAAAGYVVILYGSATGLSGQRSQGWDQNSPGIAGGAEAWDTLGKSLAAADFDRDGYDDLAIGVPGEDIGSIKNAGAVNLIYGGPGGLSSSGNQCWHQNSSGIAGGAEAADAFGESLAAGDFDGDGYADLAVGVPGEAIGSIAAAGMVNVIFGGSAGLSSAGNQVWHQDVPGIPERADPGDRFGTSLAAADFDGDGREDLAVGVPREDIGTIPDAGAVHVIPGSSSGLTTSRNQYWHEGTSGITSGGAEAADRFGESLAAGDLDGDGHADLVVGIPREDGRHTPDLGAVRVLYGSRSLLTAADNQLWSFGDEFFGAGWFGYGLALGDFDRDGYDDLGVGAPRAPVHNATEGGVVQVLNGSRFKDGDEWYSSIGRYAPSRTIWYQGK